MTELLLGTSLTSEQREYAEMNRHAAQSLLIIINDLLDFSKIEAGRFELDPTTFSLSELLNKTVKPLGVRGSEKGLEMRLEGEPRSFPNLWWRMPFGFSRSSSI